jgi:hypothetical protein
MLAGGSISKVNVSCHYLNFHESEDMRMASFQEINADLKDYKIKKSLSGRLPHLPQLENLDGQANNQVISCENVGITRYPAFT